MSDRPPENPVSADADASSADAPPRSLSEILEELSLIGNAQRGDAWAMRGAVSELSRALAKLFEMIRADRAEQRGRIAELEAALSQAHARVRALEAGEELDIPAPPPNDFDQLRSAAERLRARTEQLVREAGTPAEEAARIEAARQAQVDAHDARVAAEAEPEAQAEPEAPKPGILRIFPGAVLRSGQAEALDVESDLGLEEEAEPQRLARAVAVEVPRPEAAAEPEADPGPPEPGPPKHTAPSTLRRVEPVAIAPRPAVKRRGLRRRRIDARKLGAVEPAAALRAMVSAVDQLWTAGHTISLVIAHTDGGALRVSGGDREPLRVDEVEPGTPARTTITATSGQLVPLFGRLELTSDQSAPLIHGGRRDADLLVGWIDRAQRLPVSQL